MIILSLLVLLLNVVFASNAFSGCLNSNGLRGAAYAPTFRLHSDKHTANTPGVYEIEASRQLSLGIARHGSLKKSRGAHVVIYSKSKGSVYRLVCERELLVNESYEGVDIEGEDDEDIQWKVEVYDKDEGKPNLLEIHFWSKLNPSKELKAVSSSAMPLAYLQFLKSFNYDDRLISACDRSLVDEQLIEKVSVLPLPPMSKRVPFISTVQAGRNLYLKMNGSQSGVASSVITLFAKTSDVHAFIPICKAALSIGEATFVHATLPWDNWSMDTSWRIEVVGDTTGITNTVPSATLAVMTDSGLPLRIQKYGVESQFTCLNEFRPRFPRNPTSESTSFRYAKAVLLHVEFDDPSSYLTDPGREAFDQLLLRMLNAWKGVCFECTAFHFALIHVGERWYVTNHLLEYLNVKKTPIKESSNPPPLQLGRPNPKRNILGRGNTNISIYGHEDKDKLMQMICGVSDPRMEVPLSYLKGAISCPNETHTSAAVTVLISLLNNGTSCSNSENVVACEQDNYSIELNVRDFSFDDHNGKNIFGNGKKHVPLAHVLGHEFGHWIGLGHIDSREGMMAESLEQSRCLDDITTSALNALMTGTRSPVNKPGALLYESR